MAIQWPDLGRERGQTSSHSPFRSTALCDVLTAEPSSVVQLQIEGSSWSKTHMFTVKVFFFSIQNSPRQDVMDAEWKREQQKDIEQLCPKSKDKLKAEMERKHCIQVWIKKEMGVLNH